MWKFEPILKSLIWGGEKIAAFKGITTDRHAIGESWELSGLAGDESVVSSDEDRGMSLSALIERDGAQIVGQANYARFGSEFPLLIKLIDARCDLSIQVHPDDALARECHQCRGKNEMWYVVGADEGARLRLGFNRPITAEEYEQSVANDTIHELMSEYRIAEGEVYYIPAGRIHTIGAGALLVEIQQTSNITYRIYDYGRTDCDGKPRTLHTALAKRALDFGEQQECRIAYERSENETVRLLESPHFTTELLELTRPYCLDLHTLDAFVIVICTKGEGLLTTSDGRTMAIRCGETVLVPASATELQLSPTTARCELLTTWCEG